MCGLAKPSLSGSAGRTSLEQLGEPFACPPPCPAGPDFAPAKVFLPCPPPASEAAPPTQMRPIERRSSVRRANRRWPSAMGAAPGPPRSGGALWGPPKKAANEEAEIGFGPRPHQCPQRHGTADPGRREKHGPRARLTSLPASRVRRAHPVRYARGGDSGPACPPSGTTQRANPLYCLGPEVATPRLAAGLRFRRFPGVASPCLGRLSARELPREKMAGPQLGERRPAVASQANQVPGASTAPKPPHTRRP